jgi:glycosyltransferase involved in cell wall biosynthesis
VEQIVEQVPSAPPARRVSVILPAYEESGHVAQTIAGVRAVLDASGWEHEILLVDDGSTDDTAAEGEAAGARVLRQGTNRGYGAALKAGIRAARFDWILICDVDGSYPAEEIERLLARADRTDMVVGARTAGRDATPRLRRPAKWFLRKLASYLCGRRIPDLNSGLRLMRRELVERFWFLLPEGFSFTTTITMSALCNAYRVEFVDIEYRSRLGSSSIRPWHAFEFLLLILRTIVFFNPLKVFLPLGAALALAGMVKLVVDIARENLSESAVLAFLSALVVWSIGLLADQNARLAMRER